MNSGHSGGDDVIGGQYGMLSSGRDVERKVLFGLTAHKFESAQTSSQRADRCKESRCYAGLGCRVPTVSS